MIGLKNIAVAIPTERTEVMMKESISPAKSEYNVGGIVGAGTSQDGVAALMASQVEPHSVP